VAIAAALEGLPARVTAADIGAGTGISARLLADAGARVFAIEPNAAMRAQAAEDPRILWRDGTAERTGLDNASVLLVLAAQAFHWFDPARALPELHRILAAGGRLAILSNERDERDPFTAAYGDAMGEASTVEAAVRRPDAGPVIAASPLFGRPGVREFPNAQTLDRDGLVARALSASYVPRAGAGRDRLMARLHAAHASFADAEGRVTLRYATRLWTASRR